VNHVEPHRSRGTEDKSRGEETLRWAHSNEVFSRVVALALLLFAAACSHRTVPSPGIPSQGKWRTVEGTWSASGTRQTLNLDSNHRASNFDLSGSLLVTGDRGLGVGFQSQAIGFTDSLTGMQARCVWTDEHGDKVYSELKGEFVQPGTT
jgi:hypothetical protein